MGTLEADTLDTSQRTDASRDLIFGMGGDDVLTTGSGNDHVYGGTGDDVIDGGAGDDRLHGDDGDDDIRGGSGDDTIFGGIGADYLLGGDGDDTIEGGEGNDEIGGGAGNDVLTGNTGADILQGGSGDDRLEGGAGDDIVAPGGGTNTLSGGSGRDAFWLDATEVRDISGEALWSELSTVEYDIIDADATDGVFWNGYALKGGDFKVIEYSELSEDNGDFFDGVFYQGAFVDALGVIYQIDRNTHDLWMHLPDNTTAVVRNWNNGVAGISLGNIPKYYTADWDARPKDAIAQDGRDFNFDDLQGRLSALAVKGTHDFTSAANSLPISAAFETGYNFDALADNFYPGIDPLPLAFLWTVQNI